MFPVGEIRETWHFQTVILHKNLRNGESFLPHATPAVVNQDHATPVKLV